MKIVSSVEMDEDKEKYINDVRLLGRSNNQFIIKYFDYYDTDFKDYRIEQFNYCIISEIYEVILHFLFVNV